MEARIWGLFPGPVATEAAAMALRARGYSDLEIVSPVPLESLDGALSQEQSPVARYTLLGGILGGIAGFALTIWTSLQWPVRTGAKPVVSIPPFIIIAFELTILLAAIGTVLGFLLSARLPSLQPALPPNPRSASGEWAVGVACSPQQREEMRELLQSLGAKEVLVGSG